MDRKPKTDHNVDEEALRDAVVAADDTGLVSNEMHIVEAEIEEAEEPKHRP